MTFLGPLSQVLGGTFVIIQLGVIVWNLCFHPLSQIPGPKLWIAFPLLRHISSTRGIFDARMREFHRKYGDAVRFGPDEVSFITQQAWKDIYEKRAPQMQRNIVPLARHPIDIFNADEVDHNRIRKVLAPAFSLKGLQAQEPILMQYVDQLMERLSEVAATGISTDMVKWFNLTTFDMVGDLAFGESFGGLVQKRYHFLITMIFDSFRMLTYFEAAAAYPIVLKLIMRFMPQSLKEARKQQVSHVESTVQKRLENGSLRGRGDFIDAMVRNQGQKDGLSHEELVGNASNLVTAGSETSATLLSGLTYLLLRTPSALEKVTREVRTAFQSEEDITFSNATSRLPYMRACIDEAFRLYPPVPTGLQRIVPPGLPSKVSGYDIPAGTRVSVHQTAASSSSSNFHRPEAYIPERWLAEAKLEPTSPFHNDNRAVVQPFSVGPRNCIGMNLAHNEIRLIFARLLWAFDLELSPESERWNEQKSFFLWQKSALLCHVKLRAHSK